MPPLIPGPTSSWSCPSQTEHHLSIFSELTSQCLGTAWIWGTGSANKNRDSWSPEAWRSCVPEQLSMRSFLTLAKRCDHPPPFIFIDTSLRRVWALQKNVHRQKATLRSGSSPKCSLWGKLKDACLSPNTDGLEMKSERELGGPEGSRRMFLKETGTFS